MMLLNKIVQQDRGFTLVEVLVALTILTIIVISFTTLFTSSYVNIISAGNKSQATYNVQKEMEERIADELATDVGDLQIPFPIAGNINVPGGLLELDDTQGNRTSESTAFLPVLVVIIEPEPQYHLVGIEQDITVNVKTRNVVDNKAVDVSIYKLGVPETHIDQSTGVISGNLATLELEVPSSYNPGDSENDFNHIISVEIEDIDRVYEVYYRIFKPAFLAGAPNGKIYVASNAADLWQEINTTVSADILSIYSLSTKFFAVGRAGTILISDNGSTWSPITSPTSLDLHSISSNGSNFVIVGNGGTIVVSDDNGINWSDNSTSVQIYNGEEIVMEGIHNNLYAVASSSNYFVAVGNGVILFSDDQGGTWEKVVDNGSIILNDVIYTGAEFIAVGNGGLVYRSSDGIDWSSQNITSSNLNSIVYTSGS